jgi:hypothetical protein
MIFVALHARLFFAIAVACVLALFFLIVKTIAPKEVEETFARLWGVRCWIYSIEFKLGVASRNRFVNSALGLLLAVSFWVVIEALLTTLRVLPSARIDWLPIHTPHWVEVSGFILSLLMVRHHWSEWKRRRLNADMPQTTEFLLRALDRSRLSAGSGWTADSRKAFLEILMAKMKAVLERDNRRKIAFSLMERDDAGALVIVFVHPTAAPFEGNFRLAVNEGAAGAAYRRGNTMYVPSTRHLMTIDLETNETLGQCYRPDRPGCPYRCVLCVPVIGAKGVVAVLNISSTKKSSFGLFEFGVGRLMAAMMAMLG